MDHYFYMLSSINELWPEYPKDEIFSVNLGNRTGSAFASEIDNLRVLYGYTEGPRGGFKKFLVVIDPSEPTIIDQIVCFNCSMNELRENCNDSNILWTIKRWEENPELLRTEANIVGFGNTSVPHTFWRTSLSSLSITKIVKPTHQKPTISVGFFI